MWLAVLIVVPVAVGLARTYALLRLQMPADRAKDQWWRFARFFAPAGVVMIVVAEPLR